MRKEGTPADLSHVDLFEANLHGAYFPEANLQEASLGGANLLGADLRRASLLGADFQGAKNLEPDQVKAAVNGVLAFYDDDFLSKLGLPSDHNERLQEKLAELEKKEKATAGKK